MMDELDSARSGIPPSWIVKKLEVLSRKITKGATPTTYGYEFQDSGINFVKIENISNGLIELSSIQTFISEEAHENQGRSILEENDVLFSIAGTIGQTCIVRKKDLPANTNQALAIISGSTDCLVPKFLEFQLRSAVASRAKAKARGGAMNNISLGDLRSLQILVPPLNEQLRIVEKIEELFSELDKGVESLKTARAQLNVYRQAVLKHAFEGKLTAQWREENKDKLEKPEQLLARIKQERGARYERQLKEWKAAVKGWEERGKPGKKPAMPSQFKPPRDITPEEIEPLPSIPKRWCFVRLCEVAQVGSGMSVSAARNIDNPIEVAYLRVANVQRGFLDLSDIKYMSIEKYQLASLQLKDWDVLFNEGGDRDKLGRGWVWQAEITPCITQNHVFRASPYLTSESNSKLLSHWGNTFGQKYFNKTGKQTTNLASINKTVLSEFPVPLIPAEEQDEIHKQIDWTMTILDAQERDISVALDQADVLRQSILKRAFSGSLVKQDSGDEPASVLLDRIKAEREAAAKNNHSKKTKKRKTAA